MCLQSQRQDAPLATIEEEEEEECELSPVSQDGNPEFLALSSTEVITFHINLYMLWKIANLKTPLLMDDGNLTAEVLPYLNLKLLVVLDYCIAETSASYTIFLLQGYVTVSSFTKIAKQSFCCSTSSDQFGMLNEATEIS